MKQVWNCFLRDTRRPTRETSRSLDEVRVCLSHGIDWNRMEVQYIKSIAENTTNRSLNPFQATHCLCYYKSHIKMYKHRWCWSLPEGAVTVNLPFVCIMNSVVSAFAFINYPDSSMLHCSVLITFCINHILQILQAKMQRSNVCAKCIQLNYWRLS